VGIKPSTTVMKNRRLRGRNDEVLDAMDEERLLENRISVAFISVRD
jgi:hypothetical protein